MKQYYKFYALSLVCAFSNVPAYATTGYFLNANSVKAQGNAGTAIAHFQDALTIAKNPAGLSWLDSRIDVGATLFAPDRSAEIRNNNLGPFPNANGHYDGNGREYFVLPEFGLNHRINDQVNVGIAIYGNGGMNTHYDQNPFQAFGNAGQAGVNLSQVFISPSLSWQFSEQQSIGIASHILYQQFEARGLNGFAGLSIDPQHLSNNGKDSATGFGYTLGWSAQLLDERLTLGAKYSSKIKADSFDQYAGLFAAGGNFDVPESYGIGAAYQVAPDLTFSADIERILYSDIASVGQRFEPQRLAQGDIFGTEHGPGFGWQDINVYKLGITYQASPSWVFRAGYSYNDQPIHANQTFLNILAPGVVQHHLSIGSTWQLNQQHEVSVAYTHALKKELEGSQSIPQNFGAGEANLSMSQNLLGLAYGYKY